MGTLVIRKLFLSAIALCSLIGMRVMAETAMEPIKIGTTQALTGHYKEFGTEQLRGLQMWVADINAEQFFCNRHRRNRMMEPLVSIFVDVKGRAAVHFTVDSDFSLMTLHNKVTCCQPKSSSI